MSARTVKCNAYIFNRIKFKLNRYIRRMNIKKEDKGKKMDHYR